MSFTYQPATPNDITRCRYHIGDVVEPAMFSDEEITFAISEESTWQKAVISLLKSLIQRLSLSPDFEADWLKVDNADMRRALEARLADKRKELGVPAITASVTHRFRSDSAEITAPTFTDMK